MRRALLAASRCCALRRQRYLVRQDVKAPNTRGCPNHNTNECSAEEVVLRGRNCKDMCTLSLPKRASSKPYDTTPRAPCEAVSGACKIKTVCTNEQSRQGEEITPSEGCIRASMCPHPQQNLSAPPTITLHAIDTVGNSQRPTGQTTQVTYASEQKRARHGAHVVLAVSSRYTNPTSSPGGSAHTPPHPAFQQLFILHS